MSEKPRRIGPYEIRETIGRGGMAAVYEAYQPSLDRVVAIKVISAHLADEPEFMDRFRQEALAAARLTHPNIVIVHDFGEDNGLPYLVMEFVRGDTLADIFLERPSLSRIADILDQIAAGLDYAHGEGVIHRDLKPQNILVTPAGRAVLVDFGLARVMEGALHLTMTGGVVGTPEYMSPEQAAGRPIDHRSDVYALGVMLFELAVGARPFTAETPLGVLMKHLQETPPRPRALRPDLPAPVETVLLRALAKPVDERYQTAGDLARAFRAATLKPGSESPELSVARPREDRHAPPVVDLARYAGLRGPAGRAALPAQAQLQATAAPVSEPIGPISVHTIPPGAQHDAPDRTCPECGASMPSSATVCPACTYLIPFTQVARPRRPAPERKEVRVNLLPYNLRWDPPGLDRARVITLRAIQPFLDQGWDLSTSLESSGTFVQGRSASGPLVQSAVLALQRLPVLPETS